MSLEGSSTNSIPEFFHELLKLMVKQNASDLYLKVGSPPMLRLEGEMAAVKMEKLSPEQTMGIASGLMNDIQKARFVRKPEINMIYSFTGVGRFRVNIYKQRGTVGLVLRKVRDDIQTLDELNLPKVLKDMALLRRGLVLVTGPVGSGKSTTLAAMIDYINENRTGHIITIEDPIEFLHKDKNCIVSQREIESDTNSFADALKNAVRQTPDVILIGEMRDKESVSSAVFFAETGHLVLSTLHSVNANQALERIVNFFPTEMHRELFMQLSLNMQAIISQRLLPRQDGKGRVPAVEVLINNARMRELLNHGDFVTIKREMDFFNSEGMQSMDTAILELYRKNLISLETALAYADSPNDLRLRIKTLSPRDSTLDIRSSPH
jgi:twitching motility protein PilU